VTAVLDWRDLFTAREGALYGLLLDEEPDAWHIHELIEAAGVRERDVRDEGLPALLTPLQKCFGFIDAVLRRHPEVVPASCLRQGRYPWIRQRRDVHQFDVGSHLVCCCALALRGVGGATARAAGAPLLSAALDADLARSAGDVIPAAAVYHDLFKCLRPRRPLPAKLGPKQSIDWTPAGWSEERRAHRADDEVSIALTLLPDLLGGGETLEKTLLCLRHTDEISGLVKRMRELPQRDAGDLAAGFWSGHPPEHYLTGLNIFFADVWAKGFIKAAPIVRKGVEWSLEQACAVLIGSLEPPAAGTT
jgi:hypothetical protein